MTRTILFSICVLAPMRLLLAADNPEAAEKAIVDATAKTQSLEVHSQTIRSTDPSNQELKMSMESMYAFMRKDGRLFYRSDVNSKNPQTKADGSAASIGTHTQIIHDGTFVYSLNEGPQGRSATKSIANVNISYVVDASYFERLGKQYSVELLADELIDGKPQYVLECTPRKNPPGEVGKLRLYFDKATGVNMKTIGFDSNSKPIVTTTVRDVKINPAFPDDYFVFKAPAGVEVNDLSGGLEVPSTKPTPPAPENDSPKKP